MRHLVIIGSLFFAGCHADQPTEPAQQQTGQTAAATQLVPVAKEQNMKKDYPEIQVTGTVVWKNLEGGFIGFDADDGKKYMPHGLPEAYRQHGARLTISGKVITDMMTIQQYGSVLKVTDVTLISAGKDLRQGQEY